MRKTKTTSKEKTKMYQMKHREDLEDVMESFGVIVKEATYEHLYERYTSCGFDDGFAEEYEYQSDTIIYKLYNRNF